MNLRLTVPGWRLAWPLWLGFAVMMLPVYWRLSEEFWNGEAGAHGPIVGLLCLWVAWQRYPDLIKAAQEATPRWSGGLACFVLGLACYLLGVSQAQWLLCLLAHLLIPAGLLLIFAGRAGLRVMAFPLGFAFFLFPMPDLIMVSLSSSLQLWISGWVGDLLHFAGYPIGRAGVILTIGSYELMVADVCSGVRSLSMLMAIGVYFIHLLQRPFLFHGLLLAASCIPLAIFANVLRVTLLVLVTYYFGYEVGQGFLHEAAGVLLFVCQTAGLAAVDLLLLRLLPTSPGRLALRSST